MASENASINTVAEIIHYETVRDAIGSAAQNVLETMYFTLLENELPETAPETAAGAIPHPSLKDKTATLRAALTFSGEWNGTFFIETNAQAACQIAANFTGMMDAAEVDDQTAGEVLGEMANMVCGSVLSFLGRQRLFDLSSPKIVCGAGQHPPAVDTGVLQVERTFLLDSGFPIRFAIASVAFSR